ncbi:MAG: hypothetical protein Q9167_002416 [Letrouitia subvulpina]
MPLALITTRPQGRLRSPSPLDLGSPAIPLSNSFSSSFHQNKIDNNEQGTPVTPSALLSASTSTAEGITSPPYKLSAQDRDYANHIHRRHGWDAYMNVLIHGARHTRSQCPSLSSSSSSRSASPTNSGYASDSESGRGIPAFSSSSSTLLPTATTTFSEEGFLLGEYHLFSYNGRRRDSARTSAHTLPPIDTQTATCNLLAVTAAASGPARLPSLLHALPPLNTWTPPGPVPVYVGRTSALPPPSPARQGVADAHDSIRFG